MGARAPLVFLKAPFCSASVGAWHSKSARHATRPKRSRHARRSNGGEQKASVRTANAVTSMEWERLNRGVLPLGLCVTWRAEKPTRAHK